MGVDIQTYRARIGTYKHSRCCKTIEKYRHSMGSDVAVLVTNISSDISTVGCVFFIGVLLMIAGVEPNPGPTEKENTVDLKTKSAEKFPKEAGPLQTKEDNVALVTGSAVKIPEGAEPLPPKEDTFALETDSAEQIPKKAKSLQTTEDNIALETESAVHYTGRCSTFTNQQKTMSSWKQDLP
ncbi:uncharacterized protein LOC132745105 [Ruditapes philippinarum]|uniref:uncharacterized protein LOC132745105 n=1 Tax=Ruditapes philippinarum TaxID=129788 RepID=UPI00295BAB52|nr:uncharacterized protein LOC132745105 [Ruditapes philippinarum]